MWVVNLTDQESVQASAAEDLNVETRAEVASAEEGVAAPGPAVTEAVSDAQGAGLAQLSTEGSGDVRVATPAPTTAVAAAGPFEEASGTRVDLGSEPENDPAPPVVPGQTKEPHF